MNLIEFGDKNTFSINADFVSAVVRKFATDGTETGCLIYTVGDSDPFHTTELYDDVMAKLNGPTKGGETFAEHAPRFTGLTDRDGKKIFEGDILRVQDRLGVVIWNGKNGEWRCKDIRPDMGEMVPAFFHLSKVVGNIYDNHELMEEHR